MSATATIETEAKQETTAGRDGRGRFAKGNKGGPGNPFARKVAELRQALVNFVTEDDMKHVAFILKEKAMGGDLAAIKLLFHYVLGKPAETVDPDRLDVDEWQRLQERARPIEEMGAVTTRVPAEKACELTKIIWPCAFEQAYAVPMRAGLQAMDEADAERQAAAERCQAEEKSRKQGMPSPKRGNGAPPRPAESSEAPTSLLDYLATWLPSEDGPPSQNGGNGAGGPPADWMEQLVRAAEEEKQARLAVNKRRKRVGQKRMKT